MQLYKKPGKRRADGTRGESDVWWIRFKVHGRDYRRSTGELDKRAAAKAARRIRADVESRTGVPERPAAVRPLTLEDLSVWDIEAAAARNVSAAQAQSIEDRWLPVLRYYGPEALPAAITYDTFVAYVAQRRLDGVRGQTIRKERQGLTRGLKYARRQKQIAEVPELPKIRNDAPLERQAGTYYEPEVIALWLEELARTAPAAALQAELAYETGLRGEEVRRVTLEMVVGDELRLPAAATKTRSARVVPLTARALAVVRELAGGVHDVDIPLCPAKHYRACRRASRALDLPSVKLRDLRHSRATDAAHRTLVGASGLLGHADLSMTSRYIHASRDAVRAAVGLEARGTPQGGPPKGTPSKIESGWPDSNGRPPAPKAPLDAGNGRRGAQQAGADVGAQRESAAVGGGRGTPRGTPLSDPLWVLGRLAHLLADDARSLELITAIRGRLVTSAREVA